MKGMSEKSYRIGVRFERMAPAAQAQIDRFIYPLMQRKARARRAIGSPDGAERRLSARIELEPGEGVRIAVLPPKPLGALAKREATTAPPSSNVVCDISTTGCAFHSPTKLAIGQIIAVKLEGRDLSVELKVKVMNVIDDPVALV